MKGEILFPPNSSILSSMLYEGLLLIKKRYSGDIDIQQLRELWDDLQKKKVRFSFTGNDIKNPLRKLSKKYKAKIPKKFDEFIILMREKIDVEDLVIDMKIQKERKSIEEFLIGTKSFFNKMIEEDKYSFQIMKADRYQGVTSMELGLINKQVTAYADLSGICLFFLGLCSSYVTATGNDYYLLFFDTGELPRALENPMLWMSLKDILSEKLRETLNKTKKLLSELLTLSVFLNISVIELMKEKNMGEASFRLVRISKEGNTYKVYEDIPLNLFTSQRIYQNEYLIRNLEQTLDLLIIPASGFINGRDSKGDGYHAYMALRHLFNYVVTESLEHLEYFYRELHIAHEIDPHKGYLRWILKTAILR